MPRINLLPVKAAQRVDTARNEIIAISVCLVVSLIALYGWYAATDSAIEDIEAQIQEVQTDIDRLDRAVVQVKGFKSKSEVLEKKLEVIETLKRQKVGPAKMLDDLATILTDMPKVWFTALRTDPKDGRFILEGGAMAHEDISEFQLALEKRSKFFRDIKLTLVNAAKESGVSYLQWALTCVADLSAG